MSNPTYGYGGSSYTSGYSGLSSLPSDRFSAPSDRFSAPSDHFAVDPGYYRSRYSHLPSAAPPLSLPPVDVALPPGRRSLEALYHHPYPGQVEATIYTQDYMVKRPRVESKLPLYPQRPGEKDCAHYMMTRTCKYGDTCKFDHPLWVPQGGLPDWKEAPPVQAEESLPERPGETDCPYYMKTSTCKFGAKCKFNHPKGVVSKSSGEADTSDKLAFPERPSEPLCSFFAKTGMCKFGASCKFNHPKDVQKASNGEDGMGGASLVDIDTDVTAPISKPSSAFTAAAVYNSKGLPIRLDEADCPFYMKTGSCKYGSTCRFNHPDRSVINPPMATSIVDQAVPPPSLVNIPLVAAKFLQNFDLQSVSNSSRIGTPPSNAYPQRPGEMECDFYMKTGQCKYGDKCRFHHPLDRSAVGPDVIKKATVKLTLAGLPRREGAAVCAFYMKTATCKFGATCKFDHPPPGELVAMASKHGTSTTEPGSTEPAPPVVIPNKEEREDEEEEEEEEQEGEQKKV